MSNSSRLYTWCFKRTFSLQNLLILLRLLFGYWCPTHNKTNLLINSKWDWTVQSAYALQFFFLLNNRWEGFLYIISFTVLIWLVGRYTYVLQLKDLKFECKLLCPQLLIMLHCWQWASNYTVELFSFGERT